MCECGEGILWYVPKKMRAKLYVRWKYVVFLEQFMNSNANFIGLGDGSVTRARARWSDLSQNGDGTWSQSTISEALLWTSSPRVWM